MRVVLDTNAGHDIRILTDLELLAELRQQEAE